MVLLSSVQALKVQKQCVSALQAGKQLVAVHMHRRCTTTWPCSAVVVGYMHNSQDMASSMALALGV